MADDMNGKTLLQMAEDIGQIKGMMEAMKNSMVTIREDTQCRVERHEATMRRNSDDIELLRTKVIPEMTVDIVKATSWRAFLVALLGAGGPLAVVFYKVVSLENEVSRLSSKIAGLTG